MLFGIGGFEFVIIIVFALFIFGPDKLPELAKTFGKALKKFNAAKTEFEMVVKTDILKPEDMRAVRDMQEDFQSITNAVKNPMSMLNVRPSETAQKVTDEVAEQKAAASETTATAEVTPVTEAATVAEAAPVAETAPAVEAAPEIETAPKGEPARTEEPSPTPQNEAEDIWAALAQPTPAEGEK